MSAATVNDILKVEHTLLCYSDYRSRSVYTREYTVYNGAALIKHHAGSYLSFLKELNYRRRCITVYLFVTAKGKVDVGFWNESLCNKLLSSLKNCVKRAFGIDYAPAVHNAVFNHALKCRLIPKLLNNAYYVKVSHKYGGIINALTPPSEKHGAVGYLLKLTSLIHERKEAFEKCLEFLKFSLVIKGRINVRNSLTLYH